MKAWVILLTPSGRAEAFEKHPHIFDAVIRRQAAMRDVREWVKIAFESLDDADWFRDVYNSKNEEAWARDRRARLLRMKGESFQ